MAYRLEKDEPLTEGFRRVGREQLESAVEALETGVDKDPVGAVHSARKALKRERSLLRLARGAMSRKQRRRANARLRAAAHRLGQAREADAMLNALEMINDRFAGQIPEATVLSVRQRLAHERDQARAGLIRDEVPSRVADDLRDIIAASDGWRFRNKGWASVAIGLEREYRRGRTAMKRAAGSPTPERMHEWRKRTKDLWYQLRLLEPLSPGTVHGQAKDAHHLADLLGDLHDLAELDAAVRRVRADLPADTDAVMALIEHRGQQLAGEAVTLGRRVYAEKPSAFLRRMRSYWRASRAEVRAAAAERPEVLAELTRQAATA